MHKSMLLLFVAAGLAAGFAPVPFPNQRRAQAKDDLKQMQGEWVLVQHKTEGQNQNWVRWLVVIEGNRLTYRMGAQVYREWFIRVDSSRKPGVLDSWEKGGGVMHLGIYRLEGDTLTICSQPGPARPAAFDGNGKARHLMVFKRQKR